MVSMVYHGITMVYFHKGSNANERRRMWCFALAMAAFYEVVYLYVDVYI